VIALPLNRLQFLQLKDVAGKREKKVDGSLDSIIPKRANIDIFFNPSIYLKEILKSIEFREEIGNTVKIEDLFGS
jgi:hypothetical protein